MRIRVLVVSLLLVLGVAGCRWINLDIDNVEQPREVCARMSFDAVVQTTGYVWEVDDTDFPFNNDEVVVLAEGVGSAILLPEGWKVSSCVVSGAVSGPCAAEESVAESADFWATSMGIYTEVYGSGSIPPGMVWHGYSRVLEGVMVNADQYTFTWTIRPTTTGSFTILYFVGGGSLYEDSGESYWDWVPADFLSTNETYSGFAARLIESIPCAIPALSPSGTVILFAVFIFAGIFTLVRKRKKPAGTAAAILFFTVFSILAATFPAHADRLRPFTLEESVFLFKQLRQDAALQSKFFADIKGFMASWFDLTEKQKLLLGNMSEAKMESAARAALTCDGDCPLVFLDQLILKEKTQK
ncbi:MAG: hypothetical protein MUE70_01465 [Desulfobacterales bacterium]|jgi:hypothetical protein|nr:hypothetical protein [Desulfobacterales bacterium]